MVIKKDYRVAEGKSLTELVDKVNQFIKRDYIPVGGVAISSSSGITEANTRTTRETFYQAMYKEVRTDSVM